MAPLARALAVLAALAVSLDEGGGAPGGAPAWSSGPGHGEIMVRVFKRGLLSGLAHDHRFEATDWRATARFDPGSPDPVRVDVVVGAVSLRDRQEALSGPDREKVNRQAAGPDTLDAARFPEIRFHAERLALGGVGPTAGLITGELVGTLSLRGVERPLTLPVTLWREGEGWRVTGSTRLQQSDFGIVPFSGFMGTVSVRDQVEIGYDLLLAPAR